MQSLVSVKCSALAKRVHQNSSFLHFGTRIQDDALIKTCNDDNDCIKQCFMNKLHAISGSLGSKSIQECLKLNDFKVKVDNFWQILHKVKNDPKL